MPSMNPLLFANLSNHRRLLESGTAYGTARLVLNIGFILAGITGVVAAYVWVTTFGGLLLATGGALPDAMVLVNRVLLTGGVLAYVACIYVTWVAVRAFFDIADACLAISLNGPEVHALPSDGDRGPRQGGGDWPEPPKPLIPTPAAVKPEDAKYLPKG
jgi:hypothetical protein